VRAYIQELLDDVLAVCIHPERMFVFEPVLVGIV